MHIGKEQAAWVWQTPQTSGSLYLYEKHYNTINICNGVGQVLFSVRGKRQPLRLL
ncbi:hypothetical protein Pcar_3177 [Syntrophotalea carbinolica DSM 2380]|uniref:Uncharacterized protein n=1 Tax=Syntrophotalea carbinolica (strain DSM 2380 / NBRC 103641 / GraBd1) TaxID=338963 RepID=Q0C6Z0_SYNC1|nr:hypothetical protein Pcar_3177 [Syntrophotalea carbinolica DSM 2380]